MPAKLAIVINEHRLRQLMLEFLREQNYDDEELLYQLKFSEFMLWLQRRQQGRDSDGEKNPHTEGVGHRY